MPSIEDVTLDDLAKAIEKTQTSMNITAGKLVPVTEDMYPAALKVQQECFIGDEPTSQAVGLGWSKEFEAMLVDTFKENLSFALVDVDTGDIMGLRCTRGIKRGTKEGSMDVSQFEDGPLKELIRLMQTSLEQAKFFETYDANEAFQYFGLCVQEKYRRRGLATLIMEASLKVIEHLGFDSFYIRGNASSKYSQAIYDKLGFKLLAEVEYDSYCVNGDYILRGKTGVHEFVKEYMYFKNASSNN